MIVSHHEDGRQQQNAVIVSGVLAMALIANWLASRFLRCPSAPRTSRAIGICVGLYFVDLVKFAFLSSVMKGLVAGAG